MSHRKHKHLSPLLDDSLVKDIEGLLDDPDVKEPVRSALQRIQGGVEQLRADVDREERAEKMKLGAEPKKDEAKEAPKRDDEPAERRARSSVDPAPKPAPKKADKE